MATVTPKYAPAEVKSVSLELDAAEAKHVLNAIYYYESRKYLSDYRGVYSALSRALERKIDINTVKFGAGSNSVSVASF